jgi:1,2-diacylglycerol 3-alpha-glucosyltransferase
VLELLRVLAPLLQDNRHCKVLFVGRGPARKQVIKTARREKLSRQTIFAGSVAWEQMYKLYSSADLFATASLSEVHPLTLIEASMCGLPIVARRDDSFVDLVKDGYNGYLVDSDRQIAERLSSILSDENKLLKFSRNGLTLSEQFDAKTQVQRLESLYRQVVAHQSSRE